MKPNAQQDRTGIYAAKLRNQAAWSVLTDDQANPAKIQIEYRAYVAKRIADGKFTRHIGRTRQRQEWYESLVRPRGMSSSEKLSDDDKRKRQEAYGFIPDKWERFPEGRIHPTIARLYFGRCITRPAGYLPA